MNVLPLQPPLSRPGCFYVYLLGRPDGTVFYVGKGVNGRVNDHEGEANRGCKCNKCKVIRGIWKEDKEIVKRIIFETDNERQALNYEAQLIAKFRAQLVNVKHGHGGGHRSLLVAQETFDVLRLPPAPRSKRPSKEELRKKRMFRAVDMINMLNRQIGQAKRYHEEDQIPYLEAEIAAYYLWIRTPKQLRLEGFD